MGAVRIAKPLPTAPTPTPPLKGRGFKVADEKHVLAILDNPTAPALPPSQPPPDPEMLAAILYTSGSTGQPERRHAIPRKPRSRRGQRCPISRSQSPTIKPSPSSPLSFDYGQNQLLLSTWRAGGCVVPLDYLTPRDVIKACAKHGITTLAAVPPLWVQLAEQEWPAEAKEIHAASDQFGRCADAQPRKKCCAAFF